jgi:hypothetical protein
MLRREHASVELSSTNAKHKIQTNRKGERECMSERGPTVLLIFDGNSARHYHGAARIAVLGATPIVAKRLIGVFGGPCPLLGMDVG